MLTTIASLVLFHAFSTAPPDDLRGEALMQALQRGGYTIVLRHARTDRSFQEEVASMPRLRSQQRNLNDDGVRDARRMGAVFAKYRIPFGAVVSSPMFRALETADLAGHPATDTTMVLRTFPTTEAQRELIAEEPRAGTNRLLVTHHFVIEQHVPGIRPGDIGESEAVVVRATGGGRYELVGRILLSDWATLAGEEGREADRGAVGPPLAHGGQGRAAPMVHGVAPIVWPAGEMARLAQEYLAAFNTGDTTTMRGFLETRMDVGSQPMSTRLATYGRLFEAHAPLMPTTLEAASDVEVTLLVRGRRSSIRMVLRRRDVTASRLASVTFQVEGGHS